MAYFNIERYMARWNFQQHFGDLNIGYRNAGTMRWKLIRVDNADEYSVMIDLLRNEKPVWYDDRNHYLQTTHSEIVGEGDG